MRVIAIGTSSSASDMTTLVIPLEYKIHCRFHMPDGRWLKPVSVLNLTLPIGYGWWLSDRLIREFIYDCPPPTTDERPDAVTMLVGEPINSTVELFDDPTRTACVPIEYPEKPPIKGDIAACVQVFVTFFSKIRCNF